MRISFIGGGNMARAIIGGLIKKGYAPGDMCVVEISPEARDILHAQFKIKVQEALDASFAACDVMVLAVKPQQLKSIAQTLIPYLNNQLVISIAAGIRNASLTDWLGGYALTVRAMPNMPALIGAGITALYANPAVAAARQKSAADILSAVGKTLWVENEAHMDAVTAVSGSGPAYVLYFMEALQAAAEELGLTPDQAILLTEETFVGAAQLAQASTESFATLRGQVTSKGGTTEKALKEMERHAVKENIMNALFAAAQRSRELGDELGGS